MNSGQLKRIFSGVLWFAATAFSAVAQDADSWGTLRGRILYGGDPPPPITLDIERDAEVCGKAGLVDESLVVNKTNRGVQYVAIWLESKEAVPIHPDLQMPAGDPPTLDNVDCRFEPHMLVVRTGQKILLKNSDPIAHNAAVFLKRSTPFNEVIPLNKPVEKSIAKPETQPARVDCSIHAWMKAWLIVSDHPYVAVTDADGNFEIKNLPAGEWKFRFWQERSRFLTDVQQNQNAAPVTNGTWTLTIPASQTLDLGELTVGAGQFQKKKQ
jgi:hypothetical protein